MIENIGSWYAVANYAEWVINTKEFEYGRGRQSIVKHILL